MTVDPATTRPRTRPDHENGPPARAAKSSSLAMNPKVSGTPAIEAADTAVTALTGRQAGPQGRRRRRSRVPA